MYTFVQYLCNKDCTHVSALHFIDVHNAVGHLRVPFLFERLLLCVEQLG
jgi:hypothetical protein